MLVIGRSSEWVSGSDCIFSEMEAWGLRAATELADRMVVMDRVCRAHPESGVGAPSALGCARTCVTNVLA